MKENRTPIILLVDDEPVGQKVLAKSLQKEGYTLLLADSGPRAREIAIENRPDIILLDVVMPGEDGFEAMNLLHNHAATAKIPVIFLTGRDNLEDKMRGFELGAVDYITKPYQGQEVLARVRLHLKLSLATNFIIKSQAAKLREIKNAQESMLIRPEELSEARFSVYYDAHLEAGGDFYDVLKISEGIFGYFVADISGHDIATSYTTSALKALLRQNCVSIYQPVESMRMINNVLEDVLPEEKYLTACYAKLNRRAKRMSIVSGGHLPAVYLPKTGKAELIEMEGDVIGVFKDVYFETRHIDVDRGDRFFLYSDGLIEKPAERKAWTKGLNELLQHCERLRDVPLQDSTESLKNRMHGRARQAEDDIVILGIEV